MLPRCNPRRHTFYDLKARSLVRVGGGAKAGTVVSAVLTARRVSLATLLLIAGSFGLQQALAAPGDTRTLSLHHIHTKEEVQITFKRNGQFDEEGLKKINWALRDWRTDAPIKMDPEVIDLLVGGLSRRRRQTADPRHRRLPFSGDQLHAAQPQQRRRQAQPAYAGQSHRLLHSGRSARRSARRRHESPGWRRRLLSDLRLAVRASRRRQRPRLAADDARAARQAVPGRPHGASAARRQSAAGLSACCWPISSAATAARPPPQKRSLLASLFSRDKDAEEADDNTSARETATAQRALSAEARVRPAPLWPQPRRRAPAAPAPAVQAPAPRCG